jgi:hypothetical protein
MKRLFFKLFFSLFAMSLIASCNNEGSISELGGGSTAATTERTYTIFAPAEVIAGEPYAISLIDSQGRVAQGISRLVIMRGSTELVNFEQPDIALYSHIADEASIGAILIYTIYRNGTRYNNGSLVRSAEETTQ